MDSTAELVKVLAGALSANRIPLKYNDWKLSFTTLIDQKNIQDKEKIYYLHRGMEILSQLQNRIGTSFRRALR